MPEIYDYTDYRKFLLDAYTERRAKNKAFSHRFIAQKVRFKSAGHFSLILKGRTNISIINIERLADFLKLKRLERKYFQNMVLFNQAKKAEDKKKYFERMLACRKINPKVLNSDQFMLYDKWYHTALREMLHFYRFDGDFDKLGRMLQPAISGAQVRKALQVLQDLNIIIQTDDGSFVPAESVVSSGYNLTTPALSLYALHTMQLATESLSRVPRAERNIAWVTMSISDSAREQIVEELRAFRGRIMEIACSDNDADRVYQLNMQLFPMSHPCPKGYRKEQAHE